VKGLHSAVALVERGDQVLVVWNRTYKGWTLPGGKVEEGETLTSTLARELWEEIGLAVHSRYVHEVYSAESVSGSGRMVHVFRIVLARLTLSGQPTQMEDGAPVGWMFRDEFVAASAFKTYHEAMFAHITARQI
jgi:ADP-ribose pyrophosphatase YjhB (NUDIX family)